MYALFAKIRAEINKLPQDLRAQGIAAAAAAVEIAVRKVAAKEIDRPRWADRNRYAQHATLSAPLFLKAVWQDKISADGVVHAKDIADQELLTAVNRYLATRRERKQDMGDAKGLQIIKKKPGRPRAAIKIEAEDKGFE